MDIIDVIMYRLGRYDTKIDAMYGVWQLLDGENKEHFSAVIFRYMDETMETMLPEDPYEDTELLTRFPQLTDTLRALGLGDTGNQYRMLGVQMIAFTIALTQTSWGMAPWEGLMKAIQQYENYHLEI